MNIHTLPLGYLQTNCYILQGDSNQCLAIDPGGQPDVVLEFLGERKLAAILLTHGHFDHVGAVADLVTETGCKVYLCADDLTLPRSMTSGQLYYTDTYSDGDEITLAGLTFRVLHTPGHTPGSVCLCFGDAMFSGDTLFAGSIGRTDLPGGDYATLINSITENLLSLPDDLTVWPGHGEETTIGFEKKHNPYLN